MADATKCKVYLKNFGEFYTNQIETASAIILSRTGSISEEKLAAAVALLREHNLNAVIITTPWDQLSGAQILEAMQKQHTLTEELADMIRSAQSEEDDEEEHHHHHHHDDANEDDEHEHPCCHHHDHDDGHEDEVEYDEHIWTSPKNAVVLCRAVCDAICKADPANEDFYRANCDDYCAQIEELDARFASLCESAPHKLLVFADRFPMLYFCREFGLDYRAAFHGCSGDTEPSLATIKYLIDKVEDEDIPVVYTIDFGTKKIAAVVSECTGAAVDTLYSMQAVSRADFDAGETYLTLMERNYEALRKGLNE